MDKRHRHLAGQNCFFRSPCSTTSLQNFGNLFSRSARRSRSRATAGSLRSFFTEVAAIFSTVTSLWRAERTQAASTAQTRAQVSREAGTHPGHTAKL